MLSLKEAPAVTFVIEQPLIMGSSPETVAICGGGACGLAVLLCLLGKADRIGCIYLFEKHSQVGPGLAYSSQCGNAIINMRADTMGLYASDPLHFSRWMKSNYPQFCGNQYPPRVLYGEYLSALFDFAVQEAASQGIRLERSHRELIELYPDNGAFKLFDDDNRCVSADKVVLALGNFNACYHTDFRHKAEYIASPWPLQRLDGIPESSIVCIIGSRLSGIDAAFHLIENNHEGPIYLISRGGRLPKVQGRRPDGSFHRQYALHMLSRELEQLPRADILQIVSDRISLFAEQIGIENLQDFLRADDPIKQMSLDIADSERGSAHWRSLVDSAVPIVERCWNCLTVSEQTNFTRDWNSLWYTYVHAMPYDNAIRLQKLLKEGRVLVSNFDEIHSEASGFTVFLTGRQIHSDFLIEATGCEFDVSRIPSPLVSSLLSSKVLESHPAGGFSVDPYTLEPTTTKGLYVIGSLTTGTHFYTNGIDCNVKHASRIVQHLTGKPVYPLGHVALIIPEDLEFWVRFVLDVVPTMLKRQILPFLYTVAPRASWRVRADLSPGVPVDLQSQPINITGRLSNERNLDHSTSSSDDLFRGLCGTFGLSVQSYEAFDSSLLAALKQHYIDVGLSFTNDIRDGLISEYSFKTRQVRANPPTHMLVKALGEEVKLKVDDPTRLSRCCSKEFIGHVEQEVLDIVSVSTVFNSTNSKCLV